MGRYIPPGFVGLERAVLEAAKLLSPAEWEPSKMLLGEAAVWKSLGVRFSAEALEYQLTSKVSRKARAGDPSMALRYALYGEAAYRVRGDLHIGRLNALFLGSHDGEPRVIASRYWATEACEDVFRTGNAIVDGALCPVFLLEETLAEVYAPASSPTEEIQLDRSLPKRMPHAATLCLD